MSSPTPTPPTSPTSLLRLPNDRATLHSSTSSKTPENRTQKPLQKRISQLKLNHPPPGAFIESPHVSPTEARARRFALLPGVVEFTANLYNASGAKIFKNALDREKFMKGLRAWKKKELKKRHFPWKLYLFWALVVYCFSFSGIEEYYRNPGDRFSTGWGFGFEGEFGRIY